MTHSKNEFTHPSAKLAIEDLVFLKRDEIRGTRLGLEYDKVDLSLRDHGIQTIVNVFGSARIKDAAQLQSQLKIAKKKGDKESIARLEKLSEMTRFYDEAREFAKVASLEGGALNPYGSKKYNVIASGGGPGIMEAVNRGAHDVGAPSIGFGIELPFEQGNNEYVSSGLSFQFQYFSVRKFHMVQRSSAIVVFPGGLGSLDELAEAMTLRQTGKAQDFKVVLYGREFWEAAVNFDHLIGMGMMSASDMDLILWADTPQEAWKALVDDGLHIPE